MKPSDAIKGLPKNRYLTYKSHEKRRRAFYKYVCKEGYFEKMVNGFRPAFPDPCNPWSFFSNGYPLYEASKSRIRDQWERIGDKQLKEIHWEYEEKDFIWFARRNKEENERNAQLLQSLEGSGITSIWEIAQMFGEGGYNEGLRPLIEANAFLFAIKKHLKQKHKTTPHEQRNRTPKRTLRTLPIPESRDSNNARGDGNDQRRRKSNQLSEASTGVRKAA